MADVLKFSDEADGMLYRAADGTIYKDKVLVQFTHDSKGATISLGTLDNGIQITAAADALYSFLVRVL